MKVGPKLRLISKAKYRQRQRQLAQQHREAGNEETCLTRRFWRWLLADNASRRAKR